MCIRDRSESEYESCAKKRKGCGKMKELMKSTRLRGDEFVTTEGRLVEQKITGPKCEWKKMCTGTFTSNNRENINNTGYNGRPKNEQQMYLWVV